MPESTCSQKGICALAPEHGIFGQEDNGDVALGGADAMEQVGWLLLSKEKGATSQYSGSYVAWLPCGWLRSPGWYPEGVGT